MKKAAIAEEGAAKAAVEASAQDKAYDPKFKSCPVR